ncbi:methylhydantoinase [Natrinema sp. CBA1119]|uniref:hydantoinase B/oxoprolinase family protein n=1 Tax=Natrinema sp. CBA1119 TaxID=1608465 RepID=UPI000BF797EB|nr:hydantoinase B/oxoprolinase family protein [Natrinema sp. CBA1119]PGF14303.1 methylhydantoinase [Natrinema sp. CBA1119]
MSQQTERKTEIDAVTFEVLRSGFEHTADRMSTVLQRTSFSPIIYDMVDFSNAIFTPDVDLVGQTANCPVHLAAMHFSAEASLEEYGVDELGKDDIVLLNDPYNGGTHINDVTWTQPIYDSSDELLGFGVSRGHWTDLGGGGPGGQSWGTHLAEEGLRIPPSKIVENGEMNETLLEILKSNTRVPQYIEGDVQAHRAALTAAKDELHRLERKYGADTVRQGMGDVLDYTEERTREAIREIPDGEYSARDYGDCDGITEDSIYLDVTLIVEDDEITVDFEGTDDAVPGSVNSPKANTHSAVYYALKFFTDPDAPANAGMYRPIDIELPEGSWVNPEWPRPVIGCTTFAASKICAVIWQALADAIPEDIVAPTYSECNWFTVQQEDPDTDDAYVWSDLPPGGWGGTPVGDGMETTADPLGNCMDLPVERAELLFPVTVDRREFIPDSGGDGKYRGGLGLRETFTFHGYAELSVETSRTKEGTPGVNGGQSGGLGRLIKNYGADSEEVIGGWKTDSDEWEMCLLGSEPFQPGESFTIETQGGGGRGDPTDRDAEAVREDVRDEKVSREVAAKVYDIDIEQE